MTGLLAVTMSFDTPAVALLVVSAIAAIAFAVVFVVRWAVSFPDLPAPGPETSDLRPEPPAVANLLVNRCKVTSAAAAATLLDLVARGHLELFAAGADRFVVRVKPARDEQLTRYEHQVLDLVRAKATGGSAPLEAVELDESSATRWRDEFADAVVADAMGRGLVRSRWTRADWVAFGALAALALLLLGAAFAVADLHAPEPVKASGARDDEIGWWFVALGGVAWFGVMSVLHRLGTRRYSSAGVGATAHWLGVKRFLQHDGTFADAPPSAVAVWDRLLGYGAGIGVARAAVAAIPLEEEDPEVAWSRVGGQWHQVHVEYPTHFAYGVSAGTAIFQGLVRTLGFGVLAFVVLPGVLDVAWSELDSVRRDAQGVVLLVELAFGLLFVALGLALVVAAADGVVRLGRGLVDLRAREEVVGEVIKHHTTTRTRGSSTATQHWFAVDPGGVDQVRALQPGDDGNRPPRHATVRVFLTRHLRHVVGVEVLQLPVRDAPHDRTP